MKEILLTSSALILALLALRRLFRKVLSRRAQYALWGLVLLRLLVPASLPAADFSLLTAAEPVVSGLEGQALYLSPSRVTLTAPEGPLPSYRSEEDPKIVLGPPSENSVYSYTNSQQVVHEVEYAWQIVLADQLPPIWYGGMAVMACWLVLSNLLFWRKLRRARRSYPVEDSPRRVYLVE
ncbi:M56 family metallopeptidase, partial [Oscillibacter sp. CU971]|uniref:M56 family metallopeptidase n=1 Tax=Oscillibacter sp. CU971 TaxID=2780102 RepID=UPI00243564C8